jgi:hypothetical protein
MSRALDVESVVEGLSSYVYAYTHNVFSISYHPTSCPAKPSHPSPPVSKSIDFVSTISHMQSGSPVSLPPCCSLTPLHSSPSFHVLVAHSSTPLSLLVGCWTSHMSEKQHQLGPVEVKQSSASFSPLLVYLSYDLFESSSLLHRPDSSRQV